MKVLLDDTALFSGHAGRGIGTYTRLLLKHFERIHSVSILTGKWKELWKTVDLVHVPYLDLFAPTLPKIRKPLVVTIHDVIPLQFPQHYPVGMRGKLHFWRQKQALKDVCAVITVSHASKVAIHKFLHIKMSQIHVVLQAADPDLQAPTSEIQAKIAKNYQLPSKYMLYVGDINFNKNLPQLIKALKYLDDDIHLVLLGRNFKEQDIPEWKAIERQIALSDVTPRVHFLTDIKTGDNNALASIYAQALCYVQPSLAEGFGLPVLDALQVGTPVVASNRTSLPEVGGTVAHYVEPEAEAFATAVAEIAAYSADKRAAVIKAGQAHAATFTWENTARNTAEVYEACMVGKKRKVW
ncbi:glycosyltransferase family 4 protein [Candidatus Woesebacteria bacterium]|nr:glycosyltransferase family 4 protein [Candidatus Woesebacteria bacterium]